MARPISKVAPQWWDYTTLDADLLADAARLTVEDLQQLSRPGFRVEIIDTLEEFYAAEGAGIHLTPGSKPSLQSRLASADRWADRATATGGTNRQRHRSQAP